MKLNETYTPKKKLSLELTAKRAMFFSFTYVMQALRPIITTETQIDYKADTLENRTLTSGPCLWAFKHETTLDAVNIAPLWRQIPSLPDMKIITKHFHGKERVIDYLIGPFIIHVFRPSHGEAKTDEQRNQMKEENRKLFEQLKSTYLKGTHCLIFPEGTTDTDGTVIPIKSGCYNLSFIKQDNLSLKIPIIPVGVTYDRFAGGKHWLTKKTRNLAFIHVGTPFTYEKVHEDIKQDIKHHTSRMRDMLIDCNTITTAQLAGEYLLRRAMEGKKEATHEQLQKIVAARVKELGKVKGLVFDNALLNERKREKRVSTLYENIQDYFAKEDEINLERILLEPNNVEYKKKNPLRYSANRLVQVAEKKKAVNEALRLAGY